MRATAPRVAAGLLLAVGIGCDDGSPPSSPDPADDAALTDGAPDAEAADSAPAVDAADVADAADAAAADAGPTDCSEVSYRGQVYDCELLGVCEEDFAYRLACCMCDPEVYCDDDLICD